MQSIEGVLIVDPLKMAVSTLPFLVIRKFLGRGRLGGLKVSRRSTARGQRMNTPCAPSPPKTFCHEYVVTSSLSQGMCIANAADVASQKVIPCLLSEIKSQPSGTRTPLVVPLKVNNNHYLN